MGILPITSSHGLPFSKKAFHYINAGTDTPLANVIQAKSVCSQWCKENFPAGRGCNPCTSLANKSTGPCYECGPLSLHPEKQLCGGVCIDTSADNTNCGSCGTTCSADQACTAGACVNNEPECKAPFVLCNGACIDTSTDNANCGSCGNICSADQTCTAGACVTNERNCENPFVCGSMPTSCGNGGPEADCMCFATGKCSYFPLDLSKKKKKEITDNK